MPTTKEGRAVEEAGLATPCEICHAPVVGYAPKYCCDGSMCGCHGMPIDPCLCSTECGDALFSGIGQSFEERRVAAGIPDRTPPPNCPLATGLRPASFEGDHHRCSGRIPGDQAPDGYDGSEGEDW